MAFSRVRSVVSTLLVVLAVAGPASAQLDGLLQRSKPAAEPATEPSAEVSPETAPQPEPVPLSLSTARATMRRFLKDAHLSNYEGAAECLDTSQLGVDATQKEVLAWKLKEIMDRLGVVDLETVSDDPNGKPYRFQPTWRFAPLAIAPSSDRAWRFTPRTVAMIDDLYEELKDQAPVAGRDWLRDLFPTTLTRPGFLLPYYQWICLLVVILVGILVDPLVRFLLDRAVLAWLKVAKVEIDRKTERGVWKPVGLLAMALVWYGGTVLIGLRPEVLSVLLTAVRFFAVVAAIWTSFRLIDLLASYLLVKALQTRTRYDDLLIPLVSRTLKVFAVCVGVVVFAEAFDLPIAGLLSGLGLGGLAVALAAKDALGNLFGSVTVLVDRPFEIGDWIKTGDIEGTVETVGMRSTRVRTFYNSLITLPNSLLTTAVVDNLGRRRYRRIKTMLSLEYSTPPEKIDAFCEGVRELLRRHPYTRKDYYHVYFNQFSDSSLDVLLYCFLECPDWAVELRERHRLFVDIVELAARLGVSFAFPTRTLHMVEEEPSPQTPLAAPGGDPAHIGRRLAAEITGRPLGPGERPGPVEFLGPLDEQAGSEGNVRSG